MRTSPWRSVFPTNRSSVFSARPKPGFVPVSSAVSTPFQMPRFTHDVRSMAVWRCLRLSAWSHLRKRTPDSGSCLLKPCWIRRRFRWLLGESTDDRPEAGGLATERLPLLRPMVHLVDEFRHGRTGHLSQDQVPYLCWWIHKGMLDGHCCLRDFRRAGHAYSGQHCAVSRLSGHYKNWLGAGVYLQSTWPVGLWAWRGVALNPAG